MITQQELKRLFIYDPDTGILRNRIARKNSPKGFVGKALQGKGYLSKNVGGVTMPVHRLVWLYVYGEWSKLQIHHIDGDKLNNRLNNLREVTNRENCQQKIIHRVKRPGCYFDRTANSPRKWKAQIFKNGTQIHIGRFATEPEAYRAYLKEVRKCS